MTFQKYPLKFQLLMALIFTPLNFGTTVLCTEILKIPLFMDMIFVYAASFIGIPCGIIVSLGHNLLITLFFQHNFLHLLFSLCSITGTFLTWLIVTRYKNFSWIRLSLLIFISTIVISFEGSLIYYFFFSNDSNYTEFFTTLFLTYNLLMQNLGLQLSAFLARLPVNILDKAIAISMGLGFYKLATLIYPSSSKKS